MFVAKGPGIFACQFYTPPPPPQLFCRLLKPAPHNPQMTSTPLRTTYIVNKILICILHRQGTSEKEHKEKQQKQNTIKQLKLTNNTYMKNTKSNLIIKI